MTTQGLTAAVTAPAAAPQSWPFRAFRRPDWWLYDHGRSVLGATVVAAAALALLAVRLRRR